MPPGTTDIRKGLDIRLEGRPAADVCAVPDPMQVALHPLAVEGIRPRLLVQEGDSVVRGAGVVEDKTVPGLILTAPASGRIRAIHRGARRAIQAIEIERDEKETAEDFGRHDPDSIGRLAREEILDILLRSGYLTLIRQRPFGRLADPAVVPDSIFVNGMATAPFSADLNVVVRGSEAEFQAGLDALARLTEGPVYLCLDADAEDPASALKNARNARVHYFRGPHPSGNTSVHIHRLDPVRGQRKVWTVRGTDLLLIGHLLLHGTLPTHRTVALGGPGVNPGERRYYRIRIGAPLAALTAERLAPGESRLIGNDVLAGDRREPEGFLRLGDASVTVVPEDRERHALGWLAPGLRMFSASRTFLSAWLARSRTWAHGTNRHGSRRAMVLTGVYDTVMPMRIRVDFLLRAVLAGDVDEAIQLGLLEVVPEDFALCAFVCTSKVEVPEIIRKGLRDLQAEEE